jgi:hypothetical protein
LQIPLEADSSYGGVNILLLLLLLLLFHLLQQKLLPPHALCLEPLSVLKLCRALRCGALLPFPGNVRVQLEVLLLAVLCKTLLLQLYAFK